MAGSGLEGFDQLVHRLNSMASGASGVIRDEALQKGAEHFRQKIEEDTRRSPYNKKHAADNVIVEKTPDGYAVGYDKEHWYMIFPEFGTVKMSATPVVQPVYDNEKGQVQRIMAEVIRRRLGL